MKIKNSSQYSVNSKQEKPKNLSAVCCLLSANKRGFTLIEIIMIIVVISIAIPALLILIGGEAGRGVEPELRITATNVAQQLMDEIMTKCWDESATTAANCSGTVSYSSPLGPEGVESRTACTGTPSTYNDIDDYNGYSQSNCPVSGVNYTTSVEVRYVPYNDLNGTSASGTDYKRIAVTVTAPATNWNSSVVLTTVMTNY